jgi:hypothetical protein
MPQKINILITVKTYPSPSKSYDEIVCTAGIRDNGSFVRLYPVDYRYRPFSQWYKKYQWVEVNVEKNEKDPRPESYRPIGEIRVMGNPIGTKNNWEDRKKIVLKADIQTLCHLQNKSQQEVSLGMIKPSIISDFIIEPTEREWDEKILEKMNQLRMIGPNLKPLEKIPYDFSYEFKCCDENCGGHKMKIADWELGQMYRTIRDKYKDEGIACEKIKNKFFRIICASDRDTYFFVGTVLQFNTWIILGIFWPPK